MDTSSEVTRIANHIGAALQLAATRDVSQLSHVQQLIRALLLDELERYRQEGRFPRNPDFAERTPYFIDAEGTRCAMAHLMELGGERALVQRIASTRNNAYVRELADESKLLAWLEAAGLSVDEAAAIQPAYGCNAQSDCICGGSRNHQSYPTPAKGVLEAVVTAEAGTARVEHTYGDTLGVSIGADVKVEIGHTMGTRLLIPIDSAQAPMHGYPAVELSSDGKFHCSWLANPDPPPVSPADFARAVTSSSCGEVLASVDPQFAKGCNRSGGCGLSVAGGDASVGILLALVSAIVARRFR